MMLLNATITAAAANQLSAVFQLRAGSQANPGNVTAQAKFTYGSGGTSVNAYLQTSLDGGTTWIDIANWSLTTASATSVYSLSPATPVTTAYVPTDGTLGANTSKDGIQGNLFRVKWTSVGTYAGTTLRVDMVRDGLATQTP
jgi:hypothetical protein